MSLQKENAELKAHIERLRTGLDVLSIYCIPPCSVQYPTSRKAVDDAISLISQTPTQSLQNLKADAVEGVISNLDGWAVMNEYAIMISDIQQYATKLRQGEEL